jgi:hypothetical protein
MYFISLLSPASNIISVAPAGIDEWLIYSSKSSGADFDEDIGNNSDPNPENPAAALRGSFQLNAGEESSNCDISLIGLDYRFLEHHLFLTLLIRHLLLVF